MFGDTAYRNPKFTIMISVIQTLALPYILQAFVILLMPIYLSSHSLALLTILPFITVILYTDRIMVYRKMYYIASHDIIIQRTLNNIKNIDRYDYLLWATMESYKLYCQKYSSDIRRIANTYRIIAVVAIVLQLVFVQ